MRAFIRKNASEILGGLGLSLLLLTALWLRVSGLDQYYLSNDDVYDFANASFSSIIDVLKFNMTQDGHPLLGRVYAHYLLFLTTDYMGLRWGMSILPSLAAIVVLFLIGRKYSSIPAGLFMAYTASFSYTVVVFSESLRQYALFLLFFSLAFYYLLGYFRENDRQLLWKYYLCSVISMLLHYQTIVPVCAITAVVSLKLMLENKKDFIFLLKWIGANALICAFTALYTKGQTSYSFTPSVFYHASAPKDIMIWFIHSLRVIEQIYFESTLSAGMIISFIFLGIIYLLKGRQYYFLLTFLTVLATIALTEIFRLYPFFTMTRRLILFLPFISYMAGCGVTLVYQFMSQQNERSRWPFILCCVIFCSVVALTIYRLKVLWPHRDAEPGLHYILPKSVYDQGMRKILQKVRRDDIIICDGITANYFIYNQGRDRVVNLGGHVGKITFMNRSVYFTQGNVWPTIHNANSLREVMEAVGRDIDLTKVNNVWYINLGWNSPALSQRVMIPEPLETLRQTRTYYIDIPVRASNSGFTMYPLTWENIKAVLQL